MADKDKKKKEEEEEEEETLLERRRRKQKEDDAKGITIPKAGPGDRLPPLPQPQTQPSSGGGGGSNFLNTAMQMGKIAMMFAQEGGQIKSKTKKKKRVVRGVGAAKRGYGKATYSKKMY